eukprot:CAMPEP_0201566380 /NCGR_PEP_ID=MMETSP0190_2-20130828/6126_1 /ASSEMBLY_ACC=CAM_ASM_000263 /TAXON_ID=37353 /ORGANISM="Rosalina sp." /LENGTH=140 /DNA_ID=CAMNT_0047985013 /DNA_START=82 /DNA_END=504 /DNA_ORIENTATION=-
MADDNAPDATEEPAAGGGWKDPAQAVAFATLILISGEKEINEENLGKLLTAAKCEVDAKIPKTYERAVKKGMDLKDLIDNFGKGGPPAAGGGGGGGGAGGGATGGGDAPKEEEESESTKESSKAGPGLFGGDDSSDESSD